ncbi:MAG: tRNA (adenosine(37)-N6)-threonylcarbamoyltransferase complex ATPase subunit type 1 TsaE [Candidatus Rokubacteria bacterium]|nr:tRNA (adenosine(37)-N6)-threonylcarbamoyltransferase complex ATPase subunit type 1 TsaE [Candidatus Rokubacteria bacterium]
MTTVVETSSPEETAAVGERLGRALAPGAVVALTGELGAGKTCFIQGVVRGLGVERRATSPTFVLVNEYRGRVPVLHVDLYRIDRLADVEDLGLPDVFGREAVTLVEWADKLGPLLPADAIRVHIDGVGDEARRITIAGSALA